MEVVVLEQDNISLSANILEKHISARTVCEKIEEVRFPPEKDCTCTLFPQRRQPINPLEKEEENREENKGRAKYKGI